MTDQEIPTMPLGAIVAFSDEPLRRWTVRAGDERFTVLTAQRPFKPRGELIYTIVDRQRGVRGPCDLIGQGWDVEEPGGCDELLRALQRHDEVLLEHEGPGPWPITEVTVEVSYRNNVPVRVLAILDTPAA